MRINLTSTLRVFDITLLCLLTTLSLRIWNQTIHTSIPLPSVPASSSSTTHWAPKNAFASLCFGDATVGGTLVLFAALKAVKSKGDYVAMTYDVSAANLEKLHSHGIKTIPMHPLNASKYYMTSRKRPETESRDAILWSKLRAWQLVAYDKVIMLDSDLLVLENVDELFEMPEVAASAMVHASEKISFYKSAEYGMKPGNKIDRKTRDPELLEGWSGLNSGVTVLKPSNETFTRLLTELSILPNRPCCPSQEFIYNFFEERKQYFRLPAVYNARSISGGGSDSDELDATAAALKRHMKIYHFVGTKPWKKRDMSAMNRLWWRYYDEIMSK
ncbi:hypothetical protein HDU98_009804 [Podochytrium sp. JEL0797]|nr:hypothetical protein HDU98_009804 [Podochytrium sp. JEL0797]